MEELKNDIIKKYKYVNYVIYVKETKDYLEYYLQNEEYGVMRLIYGLPKRNRKEHLTIIENNIDYYITEYQEEVED